MTFTVEEKKDVLDLKTKPWYKVLLKMADAFELSVLRNLKNLDTSNEKDVSILAKNLQFLKWMEAFMATIKTGNNEVANRKED